MNIQFFKYQGTGNDFIILDNRQELYSSITNDQVKLLCHRKFGIGADGLMLLNLKEGYDFDMKYYNADGREGSMCGNGGRCLVKFAYHQGIRKAIYKFSAIDGDHEAEIDDDGTVSLKMNDVNFIDNHRGDLLINTGSPHYVRITNHVREMDVYKEGKRIRNLEEFVKDGINVNFVEHRPDESIFVRTFERGVEDETLSCGTGVTAAALACYHNENGFNDVRVQTLGGKLSVEYNRISDTEYRDIWLCGPAEFVFEGNFKF